MSSTVPIDPVDENTNSIPKIVVDSASTADDLSITPASSSFPTNDDVPVHGGEAPVERELDRIVPASSSIPTENNPLPSPHSLQLIDELKYLLKSTNSLASPAESVQTSQEADATGQRRSTESYVDFSNDPERRLIEGLTPREVKSLDAAERRSIAARGQRASNATFVADRSRAQSMQTNLQTRLNSQSSNLSAMTSTKPPTLVAQLSGLFWAVVAAYAFSTILFLTKLFGVDLLFGFFVQTLVQTTAFAIYAFYKNYRLLGPSESRGLMITRALFMSIGTLASFLAYYYISLADLSAIRQSQVVFTIVLSIFFLHERVTILRILGFILTLIGIVVLFRPTSFSAASSAAVNLTDPSTTWIPQFSSWNHVVGIAVALCAALMFSIASIIARVYTTTERLHNSVLCFWSSCFGLILSLLLMSVSHYVVRESRFVPHDWRLLVAVGLALASIFVFIANQKAIKRLPPSIITLTYASDIVFAFLLETLFTQIRSDLVLILGGLLILGSVVILCIEAFFAEKRKKALAKKVAQVVTNSARVSDHVVRLASKRSSL